MATEELVKESQQSYEITELQNAGTALATVTRAEIDVQISTAHAYPRSLEKFLKKAMAMLTMNKEIASECFYVIPRAGKTIEGPSVRLAEIVAAGYGNMRSGARVVAEEAEFVVAQGVCHDLENNLAVTFEVKRKILDSRGHRYNSDMIGVTGNAAASIAFRNTVFRVVPKVLWLPLYEEARKIARGDEKTFEVKREAVLVGFEKMKVPRKKIFEYLGIEGIADMNSDHIITLIGIGNAIKSGEATIADLNPQAEPSVPRRAAPEPQPQVEASAAESAKNTESQQNTESNATAEADPVITSAEIAEFYGKAFNASWSKSDVLSLVKKTFNVPALKDLRRSQLAIVLETVLNKRPA